MTSGECALVLTGGGARAAYQVGVLRGLARHLDEARFGIITGVSAGAINTVFLASRQGSLRAIVEELTSVWQSLQVSDILQIAQDLGKLAADYESKLPRALRFLTRSLGTRETSNGDFLSLLMFVPEYLHQLIEIGEADAEARIDEIVEVVGESRRSEAGHVTRG